ncbi:hypothetical protein [uncultured Draconibacterium sp.]
MMALYPLLFSQVSILHF